MPRSLTKARKEAEVHWPDSTGRRNTLISEVCVGRLGAAETGSGVSGGAESLAGQAHGGVARGPGPVLGCDRAWGKNAAAEAGVSVPAAFRWFRHAGV